MCSQFYISHFVLQLASNPPCKSHAHLWSNLYNTFKIHGNTSNVFVKQVAKLKGTATNVFVPQLAPTYGGMAVFV